MAAVMRLLFSALYSTTSLVVIWAMNSGVVGAQALSRLALMTRQSRRTSDMRAPWPESADAAQSSQHVRQRQGAGSKTHRRFVAVQFFPALSIHCSLEDLPMRTLIILAVALVATGCTRVSLDHHLNNAYRAYNEGDCAQVALELS